MTKKYLLLAFIFILGFLLRFWRIGEVPPGLNRDEASIGYTAYSLIATGKDEYGKSWPVSFKSFGDWKLPLYIYLDIVPIKLLGLTDTAVRLPSVLLSSLTVLVAYFLAKELLGKSKISLLSALFFALSPWSIHLARNASESTTAVFFTALGLVLYLKAKSNKLYSLIGTFFIVLPLFTYHGNHIFTFLLYLGLVVFSWKKFKSSVYFWLAIILFIILSVFIYSQTLFGADKTKISGLFVLGDKSLVYEKVITDRLLHESTPKLIVNLLHNKAVFTVISSLQGYLKSFSLEFLFITGGGNTQHNIPDFGNLYLWTAPFLLLGISYLLWGKAENKYFILFWLLIAPFAPSITKDAPHTNRMAPVMPLLEILTAYGVVQAVNLILQKKKIVVTGLLSLLVLLFVLNFILWTDRYFVLFPQKRAAIWGEGYTKLVSLLSKKQNFNAREVVMSRPEYSPYIYFLFYDRVDPLYFQQSVVRYPETGEGFQHVAKFGNYSFRQIDWSDDLAIPNRLYIDWSQAMPMSATNSATLITDKLIDKLIKDGKDVSDLRVGDMVVSRKVIDIKLQNKEAMLTLIKTSKLP